MPAICTALHLQLMALSYLHSDVLLEFIMALCRDDCQKFAIQFALLKQTGQKQLLAIGHLRAIRSYDRVDLNLATIHLCTEL